MRKASRILFLVGAIVSCVYAFCLLVVGVVLVVVPNTEVFVEAVVQEVGPEKLQAIQFVMIFYGVLSLIGIPFCGVNAFFGFKSFKEEKASKVLCILNIVFGALSVWVNVVGGIFGLIANGQDRRREVAAANAPVENK